ncbi:MAG: metallophosphoesterase [Clostridia bacterium]|nr:metallophosphoesterase [Clostridia bacterium]MDY5264868.1 metallophosphoesterase [Eubacteriales bacterium]MDY5440532.1 metallophosphoesterase [Eubacteriales bacterium]
MAKEKKAKKQKKVLTYEQKLKRKRVRLIIPTVILGVVFAFFGITGIVTAVGSDAILEGLNNIKPLEYDRFTPVTDENGKAVMDENGCFNFIVPEGALEGEDGRNFKVLQLTDIHIGAGAFSLRTDKWTLQTVEDLIRREKPDLVVVTGDIAYPVFFQSASLNNKKEAKIFATLMEKLGVYWTLTFGNHDTEAYSSYDREQIGEFYSDPQWTKCIFTNKKPTNSKGETVDGVGNFVINVREGDPDGDPKDAKLVHSMFMFDSHSYTDGDVFGMAWKYDYIHENQVVWYEDMVNKLGLVENNVKSTAYFHIPLLEYRDAYNEYLKNDKNNTDKVKYADGVIGESGKFVYSSDHRSGIFEKMAQIGSTNGTFCGHDHFNNISLIYDVDGDGEKSAIQLTYGMSIDYLAYPGIYKETKQRGGRIIEINSVGSEKLGERADWGWKTEQVPYWNNLAK